MERVGRTARNGDLIMGAQWFQVVTATGDIEGWGRTSKDEMPDAPEGRTLVAASDADLAQYESMRAAMTNDGRADALRLINGIINTPSDGRLRLRIVVGPNEAMVGDSVNFTVTAIDYVGNTRLDFNERVPYSMQGRLLAFNFINGTAMRSVEMARSGRYALQSTGEIALESPVEILVLE